jgi:dTMP kinase
MTAKGKFITLEGIDGAGKSTHLAWLENALRTAGIDTLTTREPGGTPLGETLRGILLSTPMHPDTETLLMFASRCEHVAQVIAPALSRGQWVISDRFSDASFAYQGGGRGQGDARLAEIEGWTLGEFQPDLTLLFDVPLEVSRDRLSASRELDRFEQEQQDFFARVREAYLRRAQRYPQRLRVIDSTRPLEVIRAELGQILREFGVV